MEVTGAGIGSEARRVRIETLDGGGEVIEVRGAGSGGEARTVKIEASRLWRCHGSLLIAAKIGLY